MSERKKFDVIIAGSGPAGVSAAITTAKAGLQVAVLDKKAKDQIGNKTCGDALDRRSPMLLHEKLGISMPHSDEVNDIIKRMVIIGEDEDSKVVLDAPGFVVDRHVYGQRLLKEAEKAGAIIFPKTRARSAIIKDGKVSGVKTLATDGKEMVLEAPIVIDATGAVSVVRRSLPANFYPPLDKGFVKKFMVKTYREIIELEEDHPWREEIVLKYEEDIPSPGYIWFFSKGEKQLNAGTGWVPHEGIAHLNVKEVYYEAMKKYYPPGSYKVIDASGGQIPVRPPLDTAVAPGFMAAGDAACHVEPATAEGHGPGLVAGYYAGMQAVRAVEERNTSVEALWDYNVNVMNAFGTKHAVGKLTAEFLEQIGSKGLQFFFDRGIITEEDLAFIFTDASHTMGMLDAIWRTIKAFPKYDLLLRLKRFMSQAKRVQAIYKEYPKTPEQLSVWQLKRNKVLPSIA